MSCTVANCERDHLARGFCVLHYGRWKRYGDPLIERGILKGTARRTLNDAMEAMTPDCIMWPHSKDPRSGYGQITIEGRHYSAHVFVCIHHHGPRPTPAHEAAHSCGTRACINWAHIRWATGVENQADRILHDTHCRGERNPSAKLTEDDVRHARRLSVQHGFTQRQIAVLLDVTPSAVGAILRRTTWGWLD